MSLKRFDPGRINRKRSAALTGIFMIVTALLAVQNSANGEELPCCDGQTIRFLYLDGERGHLDLYRTGNTLRFVRLETMQPNTHHCTLHAVRTCVLPKVGSPLVTPVCPQKAEQETDAEKEDAFTNYDDKICRIDLTVSGNRVNVWYDDSWCRLFCGGRGEFAGDYERQPRLPLRRAR